MNKADLYAKHNGLQRQDAGFVLEEYFRLMKWSSTGGDNVLDVGCGSGDVTVDLLLPIIPENYSEVVAIDLSMEMVDYAKEKYPLARLSFRQMDIANSSMPDSFLENFEHVVSFYCMHWIQNQRQAFSNMYRSLKHGGDMLITFLASNPIFQIYRNMAATTKWYPYMQDVEKHVCIYQDSESPALELEKLLTECGFLIHLCHTKSRTYSFANVNILRKSVNAVNPFLNRMPQNVREDHLDDYIAEAKKLGFLETNNNENEKISVPYTILVAYVSKPSLR